MKMTSRSEHNSAASFMASLDERMKANKAAYSYLRSMFDATEPVSVKPDWISDKHLLRHVDCSSPPDNEDDLKARLDCLSGSIADGGYKPVRVCHGVFEEDGEKIWSCYAELKKD